MGTPNVRPVSMYPAKPYRWPSISSPSWVIELQTIPALGTNDAVTLAGEIRVTTSSSGNSGWGPRVISYTHLTLLRGDLRGSLQPPRQSTGIPRSRAISIRWTSEVPSPISRILASR